MAIRNESTGVDRARRVLYRNFHDIARVVYLVEISKNDSKMFICLFPNFEKPSLFISQILSYKIGQKLLTDNMGVFENWISTFSIRYGKLWIEGYHGSGADPRKAKSVNPNQLQYYSQNNQGLKSLNGYDPTTETQTANPALDDTEENPVSPNDDIRIEGGEVSYQLPNAAEPMEDTEKETPLKQHSESPGRIDLHENENTNENQESSNNLNIQEEENKELVYLT